jgi:osmoprotectant transport system permease protein
MMDWAEILSKTGEHLYLSFTALFIACLIAIPLGIYFANHDRLATPVIRVVQVIQTIPSLALLGFMVPFFGIGTLPAIIALVLYSLLPVLQNTFTGIREVDKSLIEIGTGMGMTKRQILWLVQLPMARSFIMAGVRMAAVQTISVATIATFIGAGGLGDLIMRGIGMLDTAIILTGAIPTALLAILFDRLLLYLDDKLTPKGLRKKRKKKILGELE